MVQTITKNLKTLVTEALDGLPTITAEDALAFVTDDRYVFVDLRENIEQSKSGVISGAVSCSRGMLEYYVDLESPLQKAELARDKTFIFYCASGGRSALAAKSASQMGLGPIINLTGGFIAWKKAGGPIAK